MKRGQEYTGLSILRLSLLERQRAKRFSLCLGFWAALLFSSLSPADSLISVDGEVYQGRILHYDAFSHIVLLDDGGKVIVPRKDVERIEQDRKRRPRYAKRAKLIISVEQRRQMAPPERLLVGRLKDRGEGEGEHGLRVEAQSLIYLVESQEQYADAYRTVYERGRMAYELEYEWEKDLLVRRVQVQGRGVNLKIIGPRGEGWETLLRAGKGRIEEERSLLFRMHDPDRKPFKRKHKAIPCQRSAW